MPSRRRHPKQLETVNGKKKRRFVSVPMTDAMVDAIERTARRRGLNRTNWMRLQALKDTDYDADNDPELPGLLSERVE